MSGSSATRGNKNTTTSNTTQNPPVICLDKDETCEMGNKSCSQDSTQEMASQENCGSPIMFPSQDTAKSEEMGNDVENGHVCLEILDEETQQDDNNKPTSFTNCNNSSNSSVRPIKNKNRLSLGRKRAHSDKSDDCDRNMWDGHKAKQRKLLQKEKEKELTIDNKSKESISSTKSIPPIMLKRTFKCGHKVCRTLQDADKMDLYFAPPGVNPSHYSEIIVRKFERYRQRLFQLQLRQRIFHPFSNPIESEVPVVTSRSGLRTKRASVLMRNAKAAKRRSEKNKADTDNEELLDTFEPQTETSTSPSNNRVNKDNNLNEPADDDKGGTTEPAVSESVATDVEMSKDDDDVIIEKVRVSEVIATAWRRKRQTPVESSPVKETLNQERRRAILSESSSDDESLKFSFQTPEQKPTISDSEPTTSDAIPVINEDRPTSEEAPSKTQPKHDSVIVASNATATNHNEGEQHHTCPMCFKMFPEGQIETHADRCVQENIPEPTTRSTRKNSLDDQSRVADCATMERQWVDGEVSERNGGEMSPVIKVRTPTKVKELKMLKVSLNVRNLANEFPSTTKPGEHLEMFGCNIHSSPKSSSSGEEKEKRGKVRNRNRTSNTRVTETHAMKSSGKSTEQPAVRRKSEKQTEVKKVSTTRNYPKRHRRMSTLEYINTGTENVVQCEKTGAKNRDQSEKSKVKSLKRTNGNETLPERASRRKGSCEITKRQTDHSRRAPLDTSVVLNQDFISLYRDPEETESENKKTDVLPTEVDSDSISSSDEDISNDLPSKAMSQHDDSSALDFMSKAYKGSKRKAVDLDDDESRQKCGLCQKYIPIKFYTQHVAEEIQQRQMEKNEGLEVSLSMFKTPPSAAPSGARTNLRSRTSSKKNGNILPDFAEATTTTSKSDLPDSPLKTYTPINRSSNTRYYNQFSFNTGSADQSNSSKNSKNGVGSGKKTRTRRKKRK